jgi:hypothetical protein
LDLVLGFLGGWAYAGYAFAKLVQPGVVAAGGLWGGFRAVEILLHGGIQKLK